MHVQIKVKDTGNLYISKKYFNREEKIKPIMCELNCVLITGQRMMKISHHFYSDPGDSSPKY